MGLLIAALLFIRRRGWIGLPGKPRTIAAATDIQVQSSRRLSITTTAYVLSCRGKTYLVVESARGTQVTVTPMAPTSTKNASEATL
ncbi:hypothetical protein GCM10027066_19200 [Dyella jejuensis]